MDHYHIWCDLKPGVKDLDFSADLTRYLGHLRERGLIEGFRLTRRKLGLGPAHLGEFHVEIDTRDLAQLERCFQAVGERAGEVEGLHQAVNSATTAATFALYRDFPDPFRRAGEERF